MASLYIQLYLRGKKRDVKAPALDRLQALEKELKPGLDLVKSSCEARFPHIGVDIETLDPEFIEFKEGFEEDEWHVLYNLEILTYAKSIYLFKELNEYDRWSDEGKPLDKEIVEYLADADWSLIKPFCEIIKEDTFAKQSVSATFNAMKAKKNWRRESMPIFKNDCHYI